MNMIRFPYIKNEKGSALFRRDRVGSPPACLKTIEKKMFSQGITFFRNDNQIKKQKM